MIKDFDFWNERKQYLHSKGCNLPYHVGEVWWCYLGVNIGFEEDGTGFNSERPVVIIRGFSLEVCWVIPLSTSKKINPYYVHAGLVENRPAFAMISQIRLIDTKRLINVITVMDTLLFVAIKQAVKDLL